MRLLLPILFCLAFVSESRAERGGNKVNPFGLATQYPDPAGILFPGIATAAGINPAALGFADKSTAIQLAYGPPVLSGESHRYFASFATAKKGVGFGAGINGNTVNGDVNNGAFLGMGFDFERVALGLTVREGNLSGPLAPSVDVGLLFGKGQGLRAGLVLYGLEEAQRLDLGIGYNGGKRYNLEANVLLPPFNSFSGGSFTLSLGANLFVEFMNFLFRTTYLTGSDTLIHTIGAGAWLNQKFNLGVQFTTRHEWTAGITLVL